MNYRSQVQCYDCKIYVNNLKAHRALGCDAKKSGRQAVGRRGTVECFDCHEQVADLRTHRSGCIVRAAGYVRANGVGGGTGPQIAQAFGRIQTGVGGGTPADGDDFYWLVDVSGSMQGKKLQDAKQAVVELLDVMRASDRVALITFDAKPYFKLQPRPVEQVLRQGELGPLLARVYSGGSTAVFDAAHMALEQMHDPAKKTRMFVITDGEDNASAHSMADVRALLAQRPNTELTVIYITHAANEARQYTELCADAPRASFVVVDEASIAIEIKTLVEVKIRTVIS